MNGCTDNLPTPHMFTVESQKWVLSKAFTTVLSNYGNVNFECFFPTPHSMLHLLFLKSATPEPSKQRSKTKNKQTFLLDYSFTPL